ncbi:MAG: nucleotide exchange factor GrpE [Acidobacteria bacterium]|jgi:molecular chaperone GrpE|nr:nucleotide exchange factor GrpE [Acidobacteriota bacterium]
MTTNDDVVADQVAADETPQAAPEAPAESIDPLTALENERDELQDRLLRTAAEFDNYRKRTDRERRELSTFITSDVLREMLPVLDDLERALAAASAAAGDAASNPEQAVYDQGVSLIHRQWLDLLRKRGVEPLEVVGQPFDPEWHEAVADEPADGRPDGEITAELRRGYRIHEKLLRAAMVKVAKA